MSALSDRIAAEHTWDPRAVFPGHAAPTTCMACGTVMHTPRDLARHVADVTERAVRESIAQQLEALEHDREAINHSARYGFGTEWAEGHDDAIRRASRIAREGTTP